MTPGADHAAGDALQRYLDALLDPGSADTEYQLLRAGSVRVALAASAVAPEATGGDQAAHGARCWLDLASVLRGQPVTVASPVVAVPLAGVPGWGLSVEAQETLVQVADQAVTWRKQRGGRRWLAGLIEQFGAVVIDPAAVIEEAEGHGIQGAV